MSSSKTPATQEEAKKQIDAFLKKGEASKALKAMGDTTHFFGGHCYSAIEFLAMIGCPFKLMAYKSLAYDAEGQLGFADRYLQTLQCGKAKPKQEQETLLAYLVANDCRKWKATFNEGTFLKSVSYNTKVVKLRLHPIDLAISNAFYNSRWNVEQVGQMVGKLNQILNHTNPFEWFEAQTKAQDEDIF